MLIRSIFRWKTAIAWKRSCELTDQQDMFYYCIAQTFNSHFGSACCRRACQIPEQLDKFKAESHGFKSWSGETSYRSVNTGPGIARTTIKQPWIYWQRHHVNLTWISHEGHGCIALCFTWMHACMKRRVHCNALHMSTHHCTYMIHKQRLRNSKTNLQWTSEILGVIFGKDLEMMTIVLV